MVTFSRLFLLGFLFSLTLGCGNSTEPAAPAGSELTDYLADHPEIAAEAESDDDGNE